MPEMPAAASAMHLGAAHEKATVGLGLDPVFEGRPEARPSRAAVEFGSGVEQRLAAGGAVIDPGAVLLVERARAGAGPGIARGSACDAIPRRCARPRNACPISMMRRGRSSGPTNLLPYRLPRPQRWCCRQYRARRPRREGLIGRE